MLRLPRQHRSHRGGEERTVIIRAPLRRQGALLRVVAGAAAGGRRGRRGRHASEHGRELRTTKSRGGHTA